MPSALRQAVPPPRALPGCGPKRDSIHAAASVVKLPRLMLYEEESTAHTCVGWGGEGMGPLLCETQSTPVSFRLIHVAVICYD